MGEAARRPHGSEVFGFIDKRSQSRALFALGPFCPETPNCLPANVIALPRYPSNTYQKPFNFQPFQTHRCLKTTIKVLREGMPKVCCPLLGLNMSSSNPPSFLIKSHYALSLSTNRSQDGTIYGDSSGPLFAIYSKSVEKIDNMMAERWQKDAEGILIFVCTKGRRLHSCVLICE